MKKRIVSGILLMLCSLSVMAGPAYPGRIVYIQPDGTEIGIHLHGDEFGSWATDDAGRILKQDTDGFWRVAEDFTSRMLEEMQESAAASRAAVNELRMEYAAQNPSANFGSPKIPVILVGFQDEAFHLTAEDFTAMLTMQGYAGNGAIGSVLDYFRENSLGQFTPEFEVLGPVTLDNNKSYYGAASGSKNDALPEMALVHAAQKLDAAVDFADYDNNHDGTVDFVMFYFAGYDQAQGGSTDCIWSHAWYLSSSSNARNSRTFDNVKLDRYFCTAELKGNTGTTQCSIGTTCHEFAHTLGLPDFYDADYETNGSAASMYSFDLMSSGNYNGNSTCPPYLTAEELNIITWLDAIPEMPSSGTVTLPAVNRPGAESYAAYKTPTDNTGEYFVYEVRGGQRWDAAIPQGMMVYHVDRSSNTVSGNTKASGTWGINKVNNYAVHPCCYVVPAVDPTRTEVYTGAMGSFLFPGTGAVRTYSPVAWNENTTGYQLTNISYSPSAVTFDVVSDNVSGLTGMVTDTDGTPLQGVTISITAEAPASAAPAKAPSAGRAVISWAEKLFTPSAKRMQTIRKTAVATLVTDADGCYSTDLAAGTYLVTASLSGYVSQSATVTVTGRYESHDFCLMREGEALPSTLYAWPTDMQIDKYTVGYSSNSIMAQNQYPAAQIARYAGKQIKEISFYLRGEETTAYEGVVVVIDFDGERKATVPVSAEDLHVGDITTVNLKDQELLIPADKDLYAGVGYSSGGYLDGGYYYSFRYFPTKNREWAVNWPYFGFYSDYNLTSTGTRNDARAVYEFYLGIGDYEAPDLGYNAIADPKNGNYSAGDVFDLVLVETEGVRRPGTEVTWYLDDELVTGPSVVLTSGEHLVEARFATTEGKTKVIELTLVAQ